MRFLLVLLGCLICASCKSSNVYYPALIRTGALGVQEVEKAEELVGKKFKVNSLGIKYAWDRTKLKMGQIVTVKEAKVSGFGYYNIVVKIVDENGIVVFDDFKKTDDLGLHDIETWQQFVDHFGIYTTNELVGRKFRINSFAIREPSLRKKLKMGQIVTVKEAEFSYSGYLTDSTIKKHVTVKIADEKGNIIFDRFKTINDLGLHDIETWEKFADHLGINTTKELVGQKFRINIFAVNRWDRDKLRFGQIVTVKDVEISGAGYYGEITAQKVKDNTLVKIVDENGYVIFDDFKSINDLGLHNMETWESVVYHFNDACFTEEHKSAAIRGDVIIGMNASCARLSWRRPKEINQTISEQGTSEQWVYYGQKYLYMRNGILTTIQQ